MSTYTDTWTDSHGTVQYFTRSDGSRLRYFTAGTGPALVLMHTIRTQLDRKSTRLNSSHTIQSRMPSSA